MSELPVLPAKRECGGCTMCCKLMGIVELKKPPAEWCPHCAIGQGCKIYSDRPPTCRGFECLWLLHGGPGSIPEEERPDKSRIVVTLALDQTVVVHVDPGRQGAHLRGATGKWLQSVVNAGHAVMVVCGQNRSLMAKSIEHAREAIAGIREFCEKGGIL